MLGVCTAFCKLFLMLAMGCLFLALLCDAHSKALSTSAGALEEEEDKRSGWKTGLGKTPLMGVWAVGRGHAICTRCLELQKP